MVSRFATLALLLAACEAEPQEPVIVAGTIVFFGLLYADHVVGGSLERVRDAIKESADRRVRVQHENPVDVRVDMTGKPVRVVTVEPVHRSGRPHA